MSTSKTQLSNRELENQLQDALEHTFPASDPVTVGQPTSTQPDRPAHRRAPKFDADLVHDLARKAKLAAKSDKAEVVN